MPQKVYQIELISIKAAESIVCTAIHNLQTCALQKQLPQPPKNHNFRMRRLKTNPMTISWLLVLLMSWPHTSQAIDNPAMKIALQAATSQASKEHRMDNDSYEDIR